MNSNLYKKSILELLALMIIGLLLFSLLPILLGKAFHPHDFNYRPLFFLPRHLVLLLSARFQEISGDMNGRPLIFHKAKILVRPCWQRFPFAIDIGR